MIIQWIMMFILSISLVFCNSNGKNKTVTHEKTKKKIEKEIFLNESAKESKKNYIIDASTEELIRNLNITRIMVFPNDSPYDNSLEIHDINIIGLDVFSQLKHLRISSCDKIENLEPLKNLQNLEILDIGIRNKSIDLTPVGYLQNLKHLGIDIEKTTVDLAPLGNLKNLKELYIDTRQEIKNIESLYKNENLEKIDIINRNKKYIINTKDISSLSKLKELQIFSSSEIDLTYIGNLHNLEYLHIDSNKIINTNKLNNPNLEDLSLTDYWGNKNKKGFSPDELLNLKKLKIINLCYGEIQDVTPLLKLPNLEHVSFGDIKVDIMPLLESKTIKKITVDDEYFDKIPEGLFEKKGISLIADYFGSDK
jgi:hypothetical protein